MQARRFSGVGLSAQSQSVAIRSLAISFVVVHRITTRCSGCATRPAELGCSASSFHWRVCAYLRTPVAFLAAMLPVRANTQPVPSAVRARLRHIVTHSPFLNHSNFCGLLLHPAPCKFIQGIPFLKVSPPNTAFEREPAAASSLRPPQLARWPSLRGIAVGTNRSRCLSAYVRWRLIENRQH